MMDGMAKVCWLGFPVTVIQLPPKIPVFKSDPKLNGKVTCYLLYTPWN